MYPLTPLTVTAPWVGINSAVDALVTKGFVFVLVSEPST